ncbi:unnamed protein product [Sphagnum balticum]
MSKVAYSRHLSRILGEEGVQELCRFYRCKEATSIFLLLAVYRARYAAISRIFQEALPVGCLDHALLQLWGMTAEGPASGGLKYLADLASSPIIACAEESASSSGSAYVKPAHLALALIDDRNIRRTLVKAGMDKDTFVKLRQRVIKELAVLPAENDADVELDEQVQSCKLDESAEPAATVSSRGQLSPVNTDASTRGSVVSGWSGRPVHQDSALKKLHAVDLTEKAFAGRIEPVIGREAEIERATRILARKTKRNPLLVGEPGVGKTAIVMGVALKIVAGGRNLPHQLRNKRIFSIEMGHVLKGTSVRGSLEENLMNAIDEAVKYGDILFIDEVHTIIGAGKTKDSHMDAAQMLKTKLATGELSCIGATTWKEYRQKLSQDGAIERRFRTILVNAPSVSEAVKILLGLKPVYEKHHDVKISDEAIRAAVRLSNRYIAEKQLPDKAIDLMDEAAVDCASSCLDDTVDTPVVGVEHVQRVISREKRIPLDRLREGEHTKLLELEGRLGTTVVGQRQALKALAQAVRRARAGVNDPERPIGSFIFQGPTGVGKTETSRALANFLLDDEEALERLDMSEYMEKTSVNRLIGSNPGYVGYEAGGLLTEAVRKRPYCVLLFDEIEKAHHDVFNVLLQVMDYGKLTDAHGRQVDFRNVLLILTTNCGAQQNDQIGFNQKSQSANQRGQEAIKKTFAPEFLNRLDGIIYFDRLTMQEVRQIVDIRLAKLNGWLAEQNIRVELTDKAKNLLAEASWSEEYGARELNRTIQRLIQDPLAERIINGKCKQGDTVEFDVGIDYQLVIAEAEVALVV